jgi:uncharacterized protein (TIGR02145 family)
MMKNLKSHALQMAVLFLLALCSCVGYKHKSASAGTQSVFTDARDGKTYRIVKIGNRTWMAENLNYQIPDSSWCYDDDTSNCEKYGRLYTWRAAVGACPAGWHLPAYEEWDSLLDFAGGKETAGTKLKSGSPDWDGADKFGFSAMPGGYRGPDGRFGELGSWGGWWAATQRDDFSPFTRRSMITDSPLVGEQHDRYKYWYSVRCVQDPPETEKAAAVPDSVLWFGNTSLIQLRFSAGVIIEISGAADGAIVKYSNIWSIRGQYLTLYGALAYNDDEDFLEVKLNTEMWQDILKRLFDSGIREWKKYRSPRITYITIFDCNFWDLDIFIRKSGDIPVSNYYCDIYPSWSIFHCENYDIIGNVLVGDGNCGKYPPNWDAFSDVMRGIIKDIIKIPLDTEHKKRFGTPISDFEQSVMLVQFEGTTVLRRITGAIMATALDVYEDTTTYDWGNWSVLNASDWLDIVHALGNGACESNKTVNAEVSEWGPGPGSGKVRIEHSTKYFAAQKAEVPASDEFKKVMDNINAKIRNRK